MNYLIYIKFLIVLLFLSACTLRNPEKKRLYTFNNKGETLILNISNKHVLNNLTIREKDRSLYAIFINTGIPELQGKNAYKYPERHLDKLTISITKDRPTRNIEGIRKRIKNKNEFHKTIHGLDMYRDMTRPGMCILRDTLFRNDYIVPEWYELEEHKTKSNYVCWPYAHNIFIPNQEKDTNIISLKCGPIGSGKRCSSEINYKGWKVTFTFNNREIGRWKEFEFYTKKFLDQSSSEFGSNYNAN